MERALKSSLACVLLPHFKIHARLTFGAAFIHLYGLLYHHRMRLWQRTCEKRFNFNFMYVLCHGYTNIMVCVCVVAYFILITNYCARVRGPRSLCARTRILFWKLFISKIESVCVCRLYIEANDRTWQIF